MTAAVRPACTVEKAAGTVSARGLVLDGDGGDRVASSPPVLDDDVGRGALVGGTDDLGEMAVETLQFDVFLRSHLVLVRRCSCGCLSSGRRGGGLRSGRSRERTRERRPRDALPRVPSGCGGCGRHGQYSVQSGGCSECGSTPSMNAHKSLTAGGTARACHPNPHSKIGIFPVRTGPLYG